VAPKKLNIKVFEYYRSLARSFPKLLPFWVPEHLFAMHMQDKKQGYTLERPQTAAPFAHWVDDERGHEQADRDANGDLDHGGGDVEHNSVQAVGRGLCVLVVISSKDLEVRTSSTTPEPLIKAEAVLSAELMLPLDAREPGTWT
jgi:hypothetical protein